MHDSLKASVSYRDRFGKSFAYWAEILKTNMLAGLAFGAGIAFFLQISSTGLGYVSQILFARWLGPGEYGAYAYALSWAQLLSIISGLGLTTAVLRFIPQYITTQDMGRLWGVVSRSQQLTLVAGIVLATAGTIVLVLIEPKEMNVATLVIAMWLIPILSLQNLHMEMTRATQRIALA